MRRKKYIYIYIYIYLLKALYPKLTQSHKILPNISDLQTFTSLLIWSNVELPDVRGYRWSNAWSRHNKPWMPSKIGLSYVKFRTSPRIYKNVLYNTYDQQSIFYYIIMKALTSHRIYHWYHRLDSSMQCCHLLSEPGSNIRTQCPIHIL